MFSKRTRATSVRVNDGIPARADPGRSNNAAKAGGRGWNMTRPSKYSEMQALSITHPAGATPQFEAAKKRRLHKLPADKGRHPRSEFLPIPPIFGAWFKRGLQGRKPMAGNEFAAQQELASRDDLAQVIYSKFVVAIEPSASTGKGRCFWKNSFPGGGCPGPSGNEFQKTLAS